MDFDLIDFFPTGLYKIEFVKQFFYFKSFIKNVLLYISSLSFIISNIQTIIRFAYQTNIVIVLSSSITVIFRRCLWTNIQQHIQSSSILHQEFYIKNIRYTQYQTSSTDLTFDTEGTK